MGIERLGELSLLALESEFLDRISTNEVIDFFETMKSQRKLVLHLLYTNYLMNKVISNSNVKFTCKIAII